MVDYIPWQIPEIKTEDASKSQSGISAIVDNLTKKERKAFRKMTESVVGNYFSDL